MTATQIQPQPWEHYLLSLAHQARHSVTAPKPIDDQRLLERAYAHCRKITRFHSRTFFAAGTLLPPDQRAAIWALYAFCRTSDNIVDCPTENAIAAMTAWRQQSLAGTPSPENLTAVAWADACHRYHIPRCYAEQLLDGVARDLIQTRYQTFADLTAYAYGVASTVGLMSMHIIGFCGSQAVPFAIKLGVALQITNILRDVAEDWRMGRLYLPLEELAAFNLTEADIAAGRIDARWRAFMRFQIARNRRLYAEALPGIKMLNRQGRLAVAAAAEFYRAILVDIERHDYDVFSRRAHVGTLGKIGCLPAVWRCSR